MPRHTGYASLPLHGGKAPAWLFGRMVRLSREIIIYLSSEFGTREVLRRLSDPFWFQAFGCVLGFDWHSSGVTTTVCGAVKAGLKDVDRERFFAAGGKGKTILSKAINRSAIDRSEKVKAFKRLAVFGGPERAALQP